MQFESVLKKLRSMVDLGTLRGGEGKGISALVDGQRSMNNGRESKCTRIFKSRAECSLEAPTTHIAPLFLPPSHSLSHFFFFSLCLSITLSLSPSHSLLFYSSIFSPYFSTRRLALIVAKLPQTRKNAKWPGRFGPRLARLSCVFVKMHYIRICITLA